MNEDLTNPPTEGAMTAALDPQQLSAGQIRILQMVDEKNLDIDDFAAAMQAFMDAYQAAKA